MTKGWRWLLSIAAVVGLALMAACAGAEPTATPTPTVKAVVATPTPTATPKPTATPGPQFGGTLKMGWRTQDITAIDPTKTSGGFDRSWLFAICDTIYAFDKQLKFDPTNSLAESFDIGPDNRTYTFHLREAKFPDGRLMTAEDVVKTIARYKDPATKFRYADTLGAIESYTAVDARTLKVVTKQPEVSFITNLGDRGACVHQPEKWAGKGDKYIGEPVMIGAYQAHDWVPEAGWAMAKSPNYWAPNRQYVDEIKMIVVKEPRVRQAALETGELDGAWLEGTMVGSVPKDPRFVTVDFVGGAFGGQMLNVAKPPMDNIWLRKAIVAAIDRDAQVNFWQGEIVSAGNAGTIGPSIPWAHFQYPDLVIPYDLDKAKEYLAKSGLSLPVKLTGGVTSETDTIQEAELIQGMLKKVGIEWSFVTGKTADMNPRQYGFAPNPSEFHYNGTWRQTGIVLRVDPEAWLRVAMYPDAFYNGCKCLPPGVLELFQKGASSFDVAERAKAYKEAQRILMEQVWWQYPHHYSVVRAGFNKNVGGTENFWGGDGQWRLKNLWLKK
ncbi:MAG: ABC transporter substrate-binding protein [Chloroflexi bacterium]|nr:ABC transporter substrate-binding protein [Chloroflexota bacterium]